MYICICIRFRCISMHLATPPPSYRVNSSEVRVPGWLTDFINARAVTPVLNVQCS